MEKSKNLVKCKNSSEELVDRRECFSIGESRRDLRLRGSELKNREWGLEELPVFARAKGAKNSVVDRRVGHFFVLN